IQIGTYEAKMKVICGHSSEEQVGVLAGTVGIPLDAELSPG
ncbi:2054_t:CDS:2, partial [Funneliformis geosporum]